METKRRALGKGLEELFNTEQIDINKVEEKIISNHTINEVINYRLNPSLAVVDISVSYESDLNEVEKVINATMEKINKTYDNLKGKCELWGVEKLNDSAVVYRIVFLDFYSCS